MMITVDTWKKMLSSAADLMTQNIELLTKIDSEIGDGDHGITVGKIAQCILKNVESCSGDAAALFDGISMSILSTPGGSACRFTAPSSEVFPCPPPPATWMWTG